MGTAVIMVMGLLGAFAASLLEVPMGELFGASLVVIACLKLTGKKIRLPGFVIFLVQIILGVSIGITVQLNQLVAAFSPLLLAGLILCMLSQTFISFLWLNKMEGWRPFESLLGAIPGALGAILVLNEEQEKPSSKVIVSHAMRLLMLVVLAGYVASQGGEGIVQSAEFQIRWGVHLIAIGAMSFLIGKLTGYLGLPAPFMVTGLFVSLAYNNWLLGGAIASVPKELILFAASMLGVLIGVRLAETTVREALRYSRAGFIITFMGIVITFGYAILFSYMTATEWEVLLLAWLPGSVEAMTAVAILIGLEPAFVAINHVMRLSLLYMLPSVCKAPLQQLSKR
ncbi:AbrB family transcriptional regulator [Photobacterium gaetbulicola]|uniref:AbrB family transcriptional regulator n=1 Tax=Photobacterium gaetbulicola TaxID=1295392 RepID=A0A0B9GZ27_9GAMM|nr:AbrB family transcriptional regulator [Photobacterium gaetbulicola]KHT61917.1 AbrB family transcriptional regulator [Photobacterium gaetbulicola]